jgi:hypothetical protein
MTTLEFIPVRQVQRRLSEGWQIFSYDPRDYAAVMYAPEGWKPQLLDDKKLYRTCSIEGCNSKHRGLGFCRWHYEHFKKHGNPLTVLRAPPLRFGCSEAGCQNKHEARGLCHKHIMRERRAKKAAFECRAAA